MNITKIAFQRNVHTALLLHSSAHLEETMYTTTYPRSLSEKEYQAILKVQRSGKLIDFKAISLEMHRNLRRGDVKKPIFDAIYRHYF